MLIAAVILIVIAAVLSFKAASEKAKQFEQEAQFREIQAERELIRGLEEGNELRRELIEQMAANIVARGASGLEIQGIENIQEALDTDAQRQLDIVASNARIREEGKLIEARIARSRARAAVIEGHSQFAGSLGRALAAGS